MGAETFEQPTNEKPVPQELTLAKHKVTSGVSFRIMQFSTIGLIILAVFSWARSQGHSLRIQSNAKGAQFDVDNGNFSGRLSGEVKLDHVPAGTRQIRLVLNRERRRIGRLPSVFA